ncbi:MAG: YtxH domain-containing protein [Flavobacterium sp.]
MKSGNVLLGIIAGAATGALLGILFAPDKGSETRKKIAKKSKQYGEDLKDKYNEIVDDISSKFKDLENGADELLQKSKDLTNKY